MKVEGPSPTPPTPPPSRPAPPPATPTAPRDVFTPGSAAEEPALPSGPPSVYADAGRARRLGLPADTAFVEALPPLRGTFPPPPPTLQRPVLLVHGMGQGGTYWFNLRNYLSSNPDNRPGPDFVAAREAEFVNELRKDPGARVFTISLSDPLGDYRDLAPELTRAIEAIRRETGAAEVDIVAHSMGGLVTRQHLDGPNDGIKRFIMLATPNHGSVEADLGLAADRLRLYRHYPSETRRTLQDLSIDEQFMGRENNPYLHGLNERWDAQRAKVEPTIITGAGIPTPDWNIALFSTGDGLVTARSAWMPDTEYYVAEVPPRADNDRVFSFKYNHGQIQDQPGVAQLVGEILGRP